MPDPLQTAVSLAAIAGIVALVWWLGLGGRASLDHTETAFTAARQLDDGFDPADAVIDAGGTAALVAARDGRVMVIKAHGNHWAGRVLETGTGTSLNDGMLNVATHERQFGTVALQLGEDALIWAARIREL